MGLLKVGLVQDGRAQVTPLQVGCAQVGTLEINNRVVPSQLTIQLLVGAVVLLAVPAVAQELTGTLLFVGPAAQSQTLLLD